jgi:ketosteroid isomerase-like protein
MAIPNESEIGDSSKSCGSGARRAILKMGLAAPLLAAASGRTFAAAASAGTADMRDANKALALSYIQACDRGDMGKLDAIIAPDAKWWILGRRDYDRKTIMDINRGRYVPGVSRESAILGIAAEGDRVAVEFETATMASGAKVYNVFQHLFIVQNGAIASAQEFLDPPPMAKPFADSQAHPPGLPVAMPDPVSPATEAHTRTVAAAFLGNNGPQTLARELRAPGFRWWLTGVGYHDLDRYISKMRATMESRPKVASVGGDTTLTGMTVEGGRVAVAVSRNLIFPDYDYVNRFLIVLILHDGKVLEMREHNDLAGAIRGNLPVAESLT